MVLRYFDAVVVGAGMGGIYQAYSLLKLGLTVRVFDNADGPGGTWWWNRYPGAMSDTHSPFYRYSWDKEDLQTYPWAHNYLDSKDILTYLNHVVDRYDLRKYMQFSTQVVSMKWDEEEYLWAVQTSNGVFTTRYIITGLGILSQPNWPAIPGRETFKGELYHTARWPETYNFANKKVGVIGNGSTGVQLITTIAPEVGSLLSFQRTPQYSIPAKRGPYSEKEREQINQTWDESWAQIRKTNIGGGFEESKIKAFDVSEAERQRIYQEAWDQGGGSRFLAGTFVDLAVNEAANETACEFLRAKIASIVNDPDKRRKLTPQELYNRRPLCDTGYYETFNRDNVDIVDVKENPIVEITPTGLKLQDGMTYDLDVLICATGFNAFDGAYRKLHIQGRKGVSLNEYWKEGPITNMGVAVHGFPNLFMILGPKSPLANVPPMLEAHIEFITAAIAHAENERKSPSPGRGKIALESTPESEQRWTSICDDLSAMMLFKTADSSYFYGANVEGKTKSTLVFFGGLAMFCQKLTECLDSGFEGFEVI